MAPRGGACTLERVRCANALLMHANPNLDPTPNPTPNPNQVRCANALLMHARCDTFVEPNGSVDFQS